MNEAMRMQWRRRASEPLWRMLALSLSLHLALIMAVQPAPGSARPGLVVISARLLETPRVRAREETVLPPVEPAARTAPAVVLPEVSKPSQPEPPLPGPALTKPEETRPPMLAQRQQSEASIEASPAPPAVSGPAPLPKADADAPSRSAEGSDTALPRVPVMLDTRWYTALEVDEHPKEQPGRGPEFDYPEAARDKGVEGTVRVMLKVDEFGRIQHLEILSGDPPGVFEAAVRKGFSQAAFLPARRGGVPVRALMQIRVRFDLD